MNRKRSTAAAMAAALVIASPARAQTLYATGPDSIEVRIAWTSAVPYPAEWELLGSIAVCPTDVDLIAAGAVDSTTTVVRLTIPRASAGTLYLRARVRASGEYDPPAAWGESHICPAALEVPQILPPPPPAPSVTLDTVPALAHRVDSVTIRGPSGALLPDTVVLAVGELWETCLIRWAPDAEPAVAPIWETTHPQLQELGPGSEPHCVVWQAIAADSGVGLEGQLAELRREPALVRVPIR